MNQILIFFKIVNGDWVYEPTYIITGTTRGLGKEVKEFLLSKNNKVVSIDRENIDLSLSYELITYLRTLEQEVGFHDVVFINNAAT